MKGCRTTDHMFVLKTLIDKYVERNSKPFYACFVDFKCTFDTVWHQVYCTNLKLQVWELNCIISYKICIPKLNYVLKLIIIEQISLNQN